MLIKQLIALFTVLEPLAIDPLLTRKFALLSTQSLSLRAINCIDCALNRLRILNDLMRKSKSIDNIERYKRG